MHLVMQCLLKHASDTACIHGCNNLIQKLRKKLLKKSFLMKKSFFSHKVRPKNLSVMRVKASLPESLELKKGGGAY